MCEPTYILNTYLQSVSRILYVDMTTATNHDMKNLMNLHYMRTSSFYAYRLKCNLFTNSDNNKINLIVNAIRARSNNMTTAAIDLDVLNELFDNQKKLDDIFGSLFDDDSFLSVSSYDESTYRKSEQKINQATYSKEDFSFNTEDEFPQKSRSIASLVMPVLMEIVIIYYGIMYFH